MATDGYGCPDGYRMRFRFRWRRLVSFGIVGHGWCASFGIGGTGWLAGLGDDGNGDDGKGNSARGPRWQPPRPHPESALPSELPYPLSCLTGGCVRGPDSPIFLTCAGGVKFIRVFNQTFLSYCHVTVL